MPELGSLASAATATVIAPAASSPEVQQYALLTRRILLALWQHGWSVL